ncbi:MAG: hypothetical protein NXI24_19290 [bacterium]|nr:hypothetical protein [bacterium]
MRSRKSLPIQIRVGAGQWDYATMELKSPGEIDPAAAAEISAFKARGIAMAGREEPHSPACDSCISPACFFFAPPPPPCRCPPPDIPAPIVPGAYDVVEQAVEQAGRSEASLPVPVLRRLTVASNRKAVSLWLLFPGEARETRLDFDVVESGRIELNSWSLNKHRRSVP